MQFLFIFVLLSILIFIHTQYQFLMQSIQYSMKVFEEKIVIQLIKHSSCISLRFITDYSLQHINIRIT